MAKMTEDQKKSRAEKKELKLQEELLKMEADNLACKLADLRKSPLPAPKYVYKVGDIVVPRTAHWNFVKILEVLDGGKIFKGEVHSDENNYGKKLKKVSVYYLSHLEILPKDLELAPQISERNHKDISFHNGDLFGMILSHYANDIDYSPVYQRELCWTQKDKESLIHSIFNNVEIGKFAFIEIPFKENTPAYELLDGKQRLTTLIEFYEDKFPYAGKHFSQLARKDKQHFLKYSVTTGRGKDEWTLKDKMEYFLKMNVSGVPQSEEHLNKVRKMLAKESK